MRGGSCPDVGMANASFAVLLVWPAMTRGYNVGVALATLVWQRPHRPYGVLRPWV